MNIDALAGARAPQRKPSSTAAAFARGSDRSQEAGPGAPESLRARRRRLRNRIVAALILVPVLAFVAWALGTNAKLFLTTLLNGLTLAALYFLVASGFTLIFGLMRNVNLAHGSLYLLGAYAGWTVGEDRGCSQWPRASSRRLRSACSCSWRCSASCRARTCARRWSPSASRSCWRT
jgi:hypothetical protein